MLYFFKTINVISNKTILIKKVGMVLTWWGTTPLDIILSTSKPTYPRSKGLVQDSMWINDLFSPLAHGHDQHIVLFPMLSLLPFIEQGLEAISIPTPHPAMGYFATSQSCSCYLTPVKWNNLPASVGP